MDPVQKEGGCARICSTVAPEDDGREHRLQLQVHPKISPEDEVGLPNLQGKRSRGNSENASFELIIFVSVEIGCDNPKSHK